MTVVWIILEIMFLVMFYKLPSAVEVPVPPQDEGSNHGGDGTRPRTQQANVTGDERGERDVVASRTQSSRNSNHKKKRTLTKSAKSTKSATEETTPFLRDPQANSVNIDIESSSQSVNESGRGRLTRATQYVIFVVSQIIREEIVVLLAVLFLTMFSQTAIEVYIHTD